MDPTPIDHYAAQRFLKQCRRPDLAQAVQAVSTRRFCETARANNAERRLAASPAPAPPAAGEAWVSVTERLPARAEKDGNPLWYSEYVLLHVGFHLLPVIGYYDYREDYKCFQSDGTAEEPAATYWQPLPTAPPAA